MKKTLLLVLAAFLALSCNNQESAQGQDAKIEAQVKETLGKLTVEEKIGQMMQLVTDLFGTNDANGVVSNLRTAIEKDSSLAARAAKDLEFAAYAAQIAGLVK